MDPDWLGGGGALGGRGPRMGQGVAQLDALQAIATLCFLADHMQDRVNQCGILGVMLLRPVANYLQRSAQNSTISVPSV